MKRGVDCVDSSNVWWRRIRALIGHILSGSIQKKRFRSLLGLEFNTHYHLTKLPAIKVPKIVHFYQRIPGSMRVSSVELAFVSPLSQCSCRHAIKLQLTVSSLLSAPS